MGADNGRELRTRCLLRETTARSKIPVDCSVRKSFHPK
jgi:hypothetical protein